MSNKFLRISLVISILMFLSIAVLFNKTLIENKETDKKIKLLEKKIKELEKVCDSLESEVLTSELKLFRLQEAYEIFKHENPTAASQYSDIISDETE